MKIAVLGTGVVGCTIGNALAALDNEVMMGSRTATNEAAAAWARETRGSHGTFAEAAAHAEVVFNCTSGGTSLDALQAAGGAALAGKLLIDVANPLDFSRGMPPTLLVPPGDSLGEQIQRAFPDTKVVKALNTMNCAVMVDPTAIQGPHDLFVCGEDADARARAIELLRSWFGWEVVIDLGGIAAARGMEAYVLFWVQVLGVLGTPAFNIHVAR